MSRAFMINSSSKHFFNIQLRHTKYWHTSIIHRVLDMITSADIAPAPNKITAAIGGLILVPIAIAAGVAFVAIKTTDIWPSVKRWFANSCFRHLCFCRWKKKAPEDLKSSPDSFCDLEGVQSPHFQADSLAGRPPSRETPTKIWHPDRSNRLKWSFGRTGMKMSTFPAPCELSSDQAPVPTLLMPAHTAHSELPNAPPPPSRLMLLYPPHCGLSNAQTTSPRPMLGPIRERSSISQDDHPLSTTVSLVPHQIPMAVA